MASWSSNPSVPHTGGTFNFPMNTGNTPITYTISYTSDTNCVTTTTYTVPTGDCGNTYHLDYSTKMDIDYCESTGGSMINLQSYKANGSTHTPIRPKFSATTKVTSVVDSDTDYFADGTTSTEEYSIFRKDDELDFWGFDCCCFRADGVSVNSTDVLVYAYFYIDDGSGNPVLLDNGSYYCAVPLIRNCGSAPPSPPTPDACYNGTYVKIDAFPGFVVNTTKKPNIIVSDYDATTYDSYAQTIQMDYHGEIHTESFYTNEMNTSNVINFMVMCEVLPAELSIKIGSTSTCNNIPTNLVPVMICDVNKIEDNTYQKGVRTVNCNTSLQEFTIYYDSANNQVREGTIGFQTPVQGTDGLNKFNINITFSVY